MLVKIGSSNPVGFLRKTNSTPILCNVDVSLSPSESFDKPLLENQDYLGLSEYFRIFHVTFSPASPRYELYMDDTCNTTTVIDRKIFVYREEMMLEVLCTAQT